MILLQTDWRMRSQCRCHCYVAVALLLAIWTYGTGAHAAVALLMEEPFGKFGAMNPTGHAAVYFNHVCAESPTQLRMCSAGEYGVVISRYHKIGGYDWILRAQSDEDRERQTTEFIADLRHARKYLPTL